MTEEEVDYDDGITITITITITHIKKVSFLLVQKAQKAVDRLEPVSGERLIFLHHLSSTPIKSNR